MSKEPHAAPVGNAQPHDLRGRGRFAKTGGCHQDRRTVTAAIGLAKGRYGFQLAGAKLKQSYKLGKLSSAFEVIAHTA